MSKNMKPEFKKLAQAAYAFSVGNISSADSHNNLLLPIRKLLLFMGKNPASDDAGQHDADKCIHRYKLNTTVYLNEIVCFSTELQFVLF